MLAPAISFIKPAGIALSLLLTSAVWAGEEGTGSKPFELTTSVYQLAGGDVPRGLGLDVNLQHSSGLGNVSLGWYRAPEQEISQTRLGWDRSYTLGPVRLMPSLQVASGGFWGGSAAVETGDSWFVGLGLGRTNLREYNSPNFDSNDAWTLSGGYRWGDDDSLSLQVVRDNRQHPDQQHVHLTYRTPLSGDQRLTVDVLSKTGLVEGAQIQRLGFSLGYDWPRYFVRLAYDPLVNFSTQDMWRLSVGTRF